MPVESGPTLYVPYSQKYLPGYLAWRLPQFCGYAEEHHVQLPLAKGDAVFFNPALFHGAGQNRSAGIERMANLLQICLLFGPCHGERRPGRDNQRRVPGTTATQAPGRRRGLDSNVVAACAEGYPFPTNLDHDSPVDRVARCHRPRSHGSLSRRNGRRRSCAKSCGRPPTGAEAEGR